METKLRVAFIIALCVCVFASGMVQAAGKRAVLIGVNEYAQESGIPALRFAVSDAEKLGRVLSQNGYECDIIVDKEATKDRIADVLIGIEQKTVETGELDVFLLYFSGRGARLPDDIQADETQDGLDECILPADAAADNPRSYIRDDALANWISAIHAKQVVLIFDCAFWGEDENAGAKGLGSIPEDVTLDRVEIGDGLPQNAVILSAALPGGGAQDGVFTPKLLESCVVEDADKDGDRIISFAEAYGYALRQLQDTQPPRLVGVKNAIVPLSPLPPLPRLSLQSVPPGAEVRLQTGLNETKYTPATVPLKQGKYQVRVQKPGFLIPKSKEVVILDYDTTYPVEPFKLEAIKVMGQASIANSAGEAVPVEDGLLTIQVRTAGEEVHNEALSADGNFMFTPDAHEWLKVGSEYEVHVTGKPVLSMQPGSFNYDGYDDIRTSVKIMLDDIPPVLSKDGVKLRDTRRVLGEQISGSVEAKDDGLGMADTLEIELQRPDAGAVSIPAQQIRLQKPGTYEFHYTVPEEQTAAGEWSAASLTLMDKAGNATSLSAAQINASFLVFASRFALGRYCFDEKNYTGAIAQFDQISPPTDDSRCMTALSYYQQDDLTEALAAFQKIGVKTNYLGHARNKDIPQIPRRMINKIWGKLLDELNAHKDDAAYMNLVAATAEELGRDDEAKIYRDYAKNLGDR